MKEYHKSEHLVFSCQYHVIFCPKYRRKILRDGIDTRLKEVLKDTADRHGFRIIEMEVMADHVHLLIDCNPRYGIMQCIKDLKRESASILLREFPSIRRRIPCMWTRSCFISSVGAVSLETVKRYIENQKGR
jgi:putative transposase